VCVCVCSVCVERGNKSLLEYYSVTVVVVVSTCLGGVRYHVFQVVQLG
jgi:hypothetical protein